jgi:hypothetical protein
MEHGVNTQTFFLGSPQIFKRCNRWHGYLKISQSAFQCGMRIAEFGLLKQMKLILSTLTPPTQYAEHPSVKPEE